MGDEQRADLDLSRLRPRPHDVKKSREHRIYGVIGSPAYCLYGGRPSSLHLRHSRDFSEGIAKLFGEMMQQRAGAVTDLAASAEA